MKKVYYGLFVILACFIGTISAKALTVQFNGGAFSGDTTTTADNCWQYGCRTSNAGVKVTVKYKKNGSGTPLETIEKNKDSSNNVKILLCPFQLDT